MLLGPGSRAYGQGFGRNKVHYDPKEFSVKETLNFEIYHYFEDDSVVNHWAQAAENWYKAHQQILRDTIKFKNPVIFYANHPDFQQTNTISGMVGVGTGGVTEALKNRVVMPVNEVNAQTDHVLGHELVHAFQYNILRQSNAQGLNNVRNIPLWMVEGLAEYMSIGSIDPNTAMWMRAAVKNKDIPTLKDLTRSTQYFPYRYGHAFWAFTAGVWGDTVIAPLFVETALRGYKSSIKKVLGVNEDTYSELWKRALIRHYQDLDRDTADVPTGKLLINEENGGRINLTPAISPDGNHVAFISDKDIFTNDVYLADAETGKIRKKLYSTVSNAHVDALMYIETGLSWSPNSDRLAMVINSDGINKLAIVNTLKSGKVKEIEIPGIPAFSNPAWSPDGDIIAISGLVDGKSDLYLYNLRTGEVFQLTDDGYSDIHPSWSPDGNFLVFSTDRPLPSTTGDKAAGGMNMAILDLKNGKLNVLDVFPGAVNVNPLFSDDSGSVFFLSDRDGFRDLYRYDLENDEVHQLTEYFTGISGITAFSPALSISHKNNHIIYSYFTGQEYNLYVSPVRDFSETPVEKLSLNNKAAMLPVYPGDTLDIVNRNIAHLHDNQVIPEDSIKEKPYKPKFKLDYIGNTGGVGVSVGNFRSQNGMSGGVNMLFSDILGDHFLFAGAALNGEIYDFAGNVTYLNRSRRVGWGLSGSHIPYRYSTIGFGVEPRTFGEDTVLTDRITLNTFRMFEERADVFAFYPFSQTTRLEIGGSYMHYSFREDQDQYYYLQGLLVDYEREKLEAPDGYSIQTVNAGFVKDNSYFGLASPNQGFRYRLGVDKYFGRLDLYTFLADFRKYYFVKPFTIAFRAMHYARLGKDAESGVLYPLSFAYPYFTRGNSFNTLSANSDAKFNINQIYGSRLLVSNLELRFPFTGPERLALIQSGFLFTELAAFVDAGLAWDRSTRPSLEYIPDDDNERVPYYTAGLSLRVNLFGAAVIEPFFAVPLQKSETRKPTFGLNFVPGW